MKSKTQQNQEKRKNKTKQSIVQINIGNTDLCFFLPANGTSVMYSTQSVDSLRSDNDTELSDPLDAFNECDIMTSDELLSRL